MVLSGSRIWSAGHEDDRICFDHPVGSCRDRWLCQRSRHQDLLGAAGAPVLLSNFWLGRVGIARTAYSCCPLNLARQRGHPHRWKENLLHESSFTTQLISNDLYAKMTAFVEPVRDHTHHEGDADVPSRESAGHHQRKTLAFVPRNVAGTERELRAG